MKQYKEIFDSMQGLLSCGMAALQKAFDECTGKPNDLCEPLVFTIILYIDVITQIEKSNV